MEIKKDVKCYLSFVLKDKVKKVPLGWGDGAMCCSSCVWFEKCVEY